MSKKAITSNDECIMQGYQVFGKEETMPVYQDSKVKEIAEKYNKSVQQIVLKFLIQNSISVIT